jgi:hypothetical protein
MSELTSLERNVLGALDLHVMPMTPKGIVGMHPSISMLAAGNTLEALVARETPLVAIASDLSATETPIAERYYTITIAGKAAIRQRTETTENASP